MNRQALRIAVVLLFAALAAGRAGPAQAPSILPGARYLPPTPPSCLDFGAGIGVVGFIGRPISPSNMGTTDTIVQRKADAILPVVGSSATIPIEMVALSLQSARPVNVGGSFFDVFVHLTPNTHSEGTMTIRHENPDDAT